MSDSPPHHPDAGSSDSWSPSAHDVCQALVLALACLPGRALPPELAVAELTGFPVEGLRLVVSEEALDEAARAVEGCMSGARTVEEVLTETLLILAHAPLIAVEHPDGPAAAENLRSRICLGTSFVFAKLVAAHLSHQLTLTPVARQQLTAAMAGGRRTSLRAVVRRFLTDEPAEPPDLPQALVLAPLTNVPAAHHPRLMDDAAAAMTELGRLAYVVSGPDSRLSPATSFDSDPLTRHEEERADVLRADLVVVVGAEHDSWGASRCVAWAEANATPVLLLSRANTPLTRVLSGSPHRTSQQTYASQDELRSRVRGWAAKQLDAAAEHCRRRQSLAAFQVPLEHAAVDASAAPPGGLLPASRLASVTASPEALGQMSVMELLCLPTQVQRVLAAPLVELLSPALGAPSDADSLADHEPSPTTSGDPRFTGTTAESLSPASSDGEPPPPVNG